jgi:hypothetical protein
MYIEFDINPCNVLESSNHFKRRVYKISYRMKKILLFLNFTFCISTFIVDKVMKIFIITRRKIF